MIQDIRRMLHGKYYLFSILGTFGVLLERTLSQEIWNYPIDYILNMTTGVGVEFLWVLCITPLVYGMCFIDDFEHKYIYQELLRKKLSGYVCSKTFVIVMSSVLSVVAGILLYVLLLRLTGHEWVNVVRMAQGEDSYAYYHSLELWFLVEQGHYLSFMIMLAVQYGMLAGIISLIAACVSLYIRNRMIVMTIPLIIVYVLKYYAPVLTGRQELNLLWYYNIWNNSREWGNAYYVKCLIMFLMCYLIISLWILIKIRRKLKNE